MAKTLAQLKAEIDKLQAEASALHDKERKEVIGRIKEAIASYGLTAADLGLTGRRAGGPSGTADFPARARGAGGALQPRRARAL